MQEKRILLIEDDRDISDLIGYILSDDFYHVTVCATVAEGESAINTATPDVLILDIMLPDGNGVDLCNKIKAQSNTRHVKVILMSALEKPANSTADHFIGKPFNIHTLKSTVSACLYSLGVLLFQVARL